MNLLNKIDIYCERVSFSLLAEPLNLFSNAAFLIFAVIAWGYFRRKNPHILIRILILTLGIIGIGSALFHSFANILTQLADIIPIACFVFLYLYTYQTLVLKYKNTKIILNFIVFFILTFFSIVFIDPSYVNGSNAYFGCVIMVFIFALQTNKVNFNRNRNFLLITGLLLCSSTFFRSIDQLVCPTFPIGTHFLWHILNALALYFAILATNNQHRALNL